jgi:hypothetical protein
LSNKDYQGGIPSIRLSSSRNIAIFVTAALALFWAAAALFSVASTDLSSIPVCRCELVKSKERMRITVEVLPLELLPPESVLSHAVKIKVSFYGTTLATVVEQIDHPREKHDN